MNASRVIVWILLGLGAAAGLVVGGLMLAGVRP
jgi:hypothetical protein